MSIEIKVPDIGADEVEVTEVMVKVGDRIEEEQSLITVEGDSRRRPREAQNRTHNEEPASEYRMYPENAAILPPFFSLS